MAPAELPPVGSGPHPRALTRRLTKQGRRGRSALKKFLYSQLALRQGLFIVLGKEQPLVRFTVERDPPSVYVVFRLRPDMVARVPEIFGLASWMRSAPLRCLDTDEPEHLFVVNYYRVSGIARGLRAEWSVFVADEQGVPRYCVVDACSNEFSIDPIEVKTRRASVEHSREGAVIRSVIGNAPDTFGCTIDVPGDDDAPLVRTAPDWATANDYIYWANGICDRTFYDASMHHPLVRRVPADFVAIDDHTPWAALVEPEPMHVLVFEQAIELTMSPWENLDRLAR